MRRFTSSLAAGLTVSFFVAVATSWATQPLWRRASGRITPMPPIAVDATLTASDAQPGDLFGFCTDVAGDVAVVGAREADFNGRTDSGVAYIFHRHGADWTEVEKLVAPDAAAFDYFGQWVTATPDTVFISALNDDHSGFTNAGAVYVFARSGDTWTYHQKLTASNAEAHDEFGWRPSVSGDTLIIGTHAGGPNDEGAAYVFKLVGDSWVERQILIGSDAAPGDRFGQYSAIEGPTLVIGADGHNQLGHADAGAAYIFTEEGASWVEQQKLAASDASAGDLFGVYLAVSGESILVNATWDNHSGFSNAGSAYVFKLVGETWVEQQKLIASDPASDSWGWFLDIDGDTVLIGANENDPFGLDRAGAIYAFQRIGDTWFEVQKLVAPDAAAGDNFGWPVPISGDTVITGAPWYDHSSMTDPGAAYVLRLPIFFDYFESGDLNAWSFTAGFVD